MQPRFNLENNLGITLVVPLAKLLHQIFAGAKGEGENRKRRCFVSTVQENTGVTYIQIGYVVSSGQSGW